MRSVASRLAVVSLACAIGGCSSGGDTGGDVVTLDNGPDHADATTHDTPDNGPPLDSAVDAGGDDAVVSDAMDSGGPIDSGPVDSGNDTMDSGGDAGVDAHPTRAVTVAVDTTQRGRTIPDDYIGLSFTRDNVSGQHGLRAIFGDSTLAPQLESMMQQIRIRHLRIVSHDATDPVPTNAQNDAFFQFAHDAGLGAHSVIYSLDNDNVTPSYTGNTDTARYLWNAPYHSMIEAFAIGNEPDWSITNTTAYTDYRTQWNQIYNGIQAVLGSPAPFIGPDTGSEYPARPTTMISDGGPPFTVRFAADERTRIQYAAQHYYGGDNTAAPTWVAGSYRVGDTVADPSDSGFTYRCIVDDPNSMRSPHVATTYWQPYPQFWSATGTYMNGDYVQDPGDPMNDYQCNVATCTPGATHPQHSSNWVTGHAPRLSALQMSRAMLDPSWLDDYATLLRAALSGASMWPAGMRFRLTESNAFSPGRDPDNQVFALALWGVDYFHWWAARGALGVDPFTILNQFNSPLFLTHTAAGDVITAEPYAYGMLAFAQGGQGTTIDPAGVTISPAAAWLTAYPVINSTGHLFVTMVNKTFNTIGSTDAVVTLRPSGFTARTVRVLRLESAPGATGNATTNTATLGGAPLVALGHWAGTWETVPVNASGGISPITVRATSAVIVDLSDH